MARLQTILRVLQRKRVFEPEHLETGNLRRCLNRWDLTALGLGSTLGVGVYVLVGSVALKVAGPSIVLSFLIAAVASLFAGLCYAEFAARVPRAGSAYIYTYVTVGELAAFVVGWNIILEALFGTASVARGLSMYVDSLVDNAMSDWFRTVMPISYWQLSTYFDLFSFVAVLVLGVVLAFGVRESSMVNNVFAVINMVTIVFIIIFGAFRADSSNWSIAPEVVPVGSGEGGFFPFGVRGMLRGAAICFYGFVGFDAVSSTAEEVHEPRRSIPVAMLAVLAVVSASYCGVAIVVTMMVPYYLQDSVASVATAFTYVGWNWARWVVSVGAIFGISASMFGAFFPLPRLLYAMASDRLLPGFLSKISTRRKSPVVATLGCAVVISIVSAILDIEQLVMMCCVGTLLSYTLVAVCVVILRYQSTTEPIASGSYIKQVFGFGNKSPSRLSAIITNVCLSAFVIICIVLAVIVINVEGPLIPAAVLHGILLLLMAVMALQPSTKEALDFTTPLVPLIPCLSIYFNIHLMFLISIQTWIRVIVWLLIGIPIYILCVCCYKRVQDNLNENLKNYSQTNGKQTLQIIVDPPTPPDSKRSSEQGGDKNNNIELELINKVERMEAPTIALKIVEDVIVQQAVIEQNEEGEAKIIDLLDQVLQAEEDMYGEVTSLNEHKVADTTAETENIPHRMSLSELSEADSDASLANIIPPKYDIIVQVHREDLSKVNEEPEAGDIDNNEDDEGDQNEKVTFFNESETSSRTDESGYSDTTDNNHLNESFEQRFENIDDKADERIPTPPPPPPPPLPLDENYFAPVPAFKSYTIPARPSKAPSTMNDEEHIEGPRESVQSNNSQDDSVMVFGSSRQQQFMSKLNNLFQNKITNKSDDKLRRSNSTGNVMDKKDLRTVEFERPLILIPVDLKKELLSRQSFTLRSTKSADVVETEEQPDDKDEAESMSREDLKSKLENIFATGGPKLLKPRLMKSNPPTPEDNQTDASSTESIQKLPKMEKNDTLKRQKDKFSEVLNSFRLSFNKDDAV